MRMLAVLTVAVALAVATTPAIAQVWNEPGDAGDLPYSAQWPVGTGPLVQINGTLFPGGSDADMYCIHIPDPTAFSATTVGGTTVDTQLWLFDPTGIGITFDDDDPGGAGLHGWSSRSRNRAFKRIHYWALVRPVHRFTGQFDQPDRIRFIFSATLVIRCWPCASVMSW